MSGGGSPQPIGIFLHAEAYRGAAAQLVRDISEGRLTLRFSSPVAHLFSHAIENVMKAFLVARGVAPGKLASKRFGHDLVELYEECIRRRLRLGRKGRAWRRRTIKLVNEHHSQPYKNRYLTTGYDRVPTFDSYAKLSDALFRAIRPTVEPRSSLLK